MPQLDPKDEVRFLSKVGKLYYEQGLTQDQIVEKLQLSRARVSRLLKQARDQNIVKITVSTPPGVFPDLELELESRYRLREAVVVEVNERDSRETISRDIGIAAANYLYRTVRDNDKIGISWGATLQCMVDAMHPRAVPTAHVVQIIGGLRNQEGEGEGHATDLCRRLSQLLGCKLTLLHAPAIVDSEGVKEALLSDSHFSSVLDLFSQLTIAIVGIGWPSPDSIVMRDSSIITSTELEGLLAQGAVGDIALRFFDDYGKLIPSNVDDRVIGITIEQLKSVERVVGIAGGPEKLSVVRGALRGRFINVLITDQITARLLLENDMKAT